MKRLRRNIGLAVASVGILCLSNTVNANTLPLFALSQQDNHLVELYETAETAKEIWVTLSNQYVLQYENKDYLNAQITIERAYDISKTIFGPRNLNTADSLIKLGIIKQTLGKPIEAITYLKSALAIMESQLSPDHPDIAIALTNLGNVYFETGDLDNSEKAHTRALTIRQNAFGDNNPSVAQSEYNLAILNEGRGDLQKAEDLYIHAINTWIRTNGASLEFVTSALNNLTNTYIAQAKFDKAITTLQKTIAIKKDVFGANHAEVAQSLVDLGMLYLEQGKYATAGNTYQEALHIAEDVLQPSDPQLALLLYTLANVYHVQARLAESNTTNTPDSDNSLNVETANSTLALFKQAIPLYERAIEILNAKNNNIAANQPVLQIVLSELALSYKAIGQTEKANHTESQLAITHTAVRD